MNIHHKNMKYLADVSRAWEKKNLSYLGIDKFSCNFIDLKHNTYLPMNADYPRYCDFIEKKLHHELPSRITPGIRPWNPSELLFQVEEAHYKPEKQTENAHQKLHAIDWTIKNENGFEIFCIVSHLPLQPHQLNAVKHWMHAYSYEGAQIMKYKPKAMLEIENRAALEEKFLNFDELVTQVPVQFQTAKFGDLILTGKEQEYIQHLMLQRPYREIAAKYQVSQVAVRKVIHNIKRKLGCPNMTIPEMFNQLNACGALGACMQSIKNF
jgi:DNA-binding CsgD family transcriptional regulator